MKLSSMIGVTCFAVLSIALVFVNAQEPSTQSKIAALTKLLRDANSEVRVKAAEDLGALGSQGVTAVPELVDRLENDKVPDVRIVAANALGAIYFQDKGGPPDPKAIRALIRAMQHDKDTVVRWKCCIVFRVIGPSAKEAAPALLELMKQKDDVQLRELACDSLGALASPDTKQIVPGLLELYKAEGDDSWKVKGTCLAVLGKIGEKHEIVIPVLIDALKHSKKMHFRVGAARGVEFLGARAKAAVPALVDALDISKISDEEKASMTRHFVLRALGSMGPEAKAAIPAIRKIAETDNSRLSNRRLAKEVLNLVSVKAQDQAAENKMLTLRKLLKDTDSEVRVKAAEDLGTFGSQAVTAVPDLVERLENDKVSDVRIVAANALGAIYFQAKAGLPDPKAVRASHPCNAA